MSKLIAFRERLNLTQEELAEISGISARTIQRIEAGTEPKGYTLKTLAKALGVTENELLRANEASADINVTWLKIINLSSLPVTLIPPANIILPLFLMFLKKQFDPLAKQLLSIQILWTLLSVIVFLLSSFMRYWFSLGSKFLVIVIILLILTNVFIIIRNAASLDKSKKLSISPGFSVL